MVFAALIIAVAVGILRHVLMEGAKRRMYNLRLDGIEDEDIEGHPWRYMWWWLNSEHEVTGHEIVGRLAAPYWMLLIVVALSIILA